MSRIGRARATQLAPRAVRVRNACLHDLAQRTSLPVPGAEQLERFGDTTGLSEAWDRWCEACVREPVQGVEPGSARRSRRRLLVRVALVGALVVLALAVSASPVGA